MNEIDAAIAKSLSRLGPGWRVIDTRTSDGFETVGMSGTADRVLLIDVEIGLAGSGVRASGQATTFGVALERAIDSVLGIIGR